MIENNLKKFEEKKTMDTKSKSKKKKNNNNYSNVICNSNARRFYF